MLISVSDCRNSFKYQHLFEISIASRPFIPVSFERASAHAAVQIACVCTTAARLLHVVLTAVVESTRG